MLAWHIYIKNNPSDIKILYMSRAQEFKRLPKELIKVGSTVSYPLYDKKGNLLMPEGLVIQSAEQLEALLERGLYLDIETTNKLGLGVKKDSASYVNDDVKEDEDSQQGEVVMQLPFKSLKIGETFQISPLSDQGGAPKYFAKYLGGLDKKSLICTVPTVDEKTIFIKEHTGFLVQLFSGKHVFRFNTIVDAVYSRPYPHMHLMFPREVYANRLRKNQRVTVSIITSMRHLTPTEHGEPLIAGRVTDLSLGGLLVEVYKEGAKEGDQIECTFKVTIEGQEVLLVLSGKVKNISTMAASDGRTTYRYGLQFNEMAFQEKLMLQHYIFKAVTGEKLEDL
jgi:c-di-GMP-binding flagellar brake protein YcgR